MVDDRVVLHVEVATEEAENVKQTYNLLGQIEKKIYGIKSTKSSKQLFENPELFDFGAPIKTDTDVGPIFRGEEEAPEVSRVSRGKKGKGAYERQDIFKNLQDKVEGLEQKTGVLDNIQGGTVQAGLFLEALGSPKSLFMKVLAPIISEFAPIIGAILITKGIADMIIAELLKPGGFFDRRFKLIIAKLIAPMIDRSILANIRQGFRHIRISSFIGPRGATRGQVRSNIDNLGRGQYIYDERLERLSKGLY